MKKILYADDSTESIGILLRLRTPALLAGLLLGFGITFITSGFERVLSQNVQVAFFLPFIVYIADAIGTQTESIYSRDLGMGKPNFWTFFFKEWLLGIIYGLLFGVVAGGVAFLWLNDFLLAMSVGVATLIAIMTAPLIALLITHGFQCLGKDPAAESGPIATVVQDMASIVIYGLVCSLIILN